MMCVGCGCTDVQACVDTETLERCHWVDTSLDGDHGVCSFCAEIDAIELELQSALGLVEFIPPTPGWRLPLYQPIALLEVTL